MRHLESCKSVFNTLNNRANLSRQALFHLVTDLSSMLTVHRRSYKYFQYDMSTTVPTIMCQVKCDDIPYEMSTIVPSIMCQVKCDDNPYDMSTTVPTIMYQVKYEDIPYDMSTTVPTIMCQVKCDDNPCTACLPTFIADTNLSSKLAIPFDTFFGVSLHVEEECF